MKNTELESYINDLRRISEGNFNFPVKAIGRGTAFHIGEELERLRQSLQIREKRSQRFSSIVEKINVGTSMDSILTYIYDSFQPLIPYDRIGFSLIENEGNTVRAHWARTGLPRVLLKKGYEASLHVSSLQSIIESGSPRIINDLPSYLEAKPSSESTRLIVEEGIRSSLTCPLVSNRSPIGFLFFSSSESHTYDKDHIDIFLDLAGHVSANLEKSRILDRLQELNRLKDRFLGMAAHDLRGPLTGISGMIEVLLSDEKHKPTNVECEILELMAVASKDLLGLVDDILDISAIESGKLDLSLKPVNTSEFLSSYHAYAGHITTAKQIRLALEMEDNLPAVYVDERRLRQVLDNLLNNAVKYSQTNTVITIRAYTQGPTVLFEIQDQGKGISLKDTSKLFTDFGKTDTQPVRGERSFGLGLAIVKRIVTAHGGDVSVESAPEIGSTFRFSIPIWNHHQST